MKENEVEEMREMGMVQRRSAGTMVLSCDSRERLSFEKRETWDVESEVDE